MDIRTATFWLCLLVMLLSLGNLAVGVVNRVSWVTIAASMSGLNERLVLVETSLQKQQRHKQQ